MEKKENRRILVTKKMLKEALLRLLEQESLEKINISELCREADINRTTFYKHYSTPRDVLMDIGTDLLSGFHPIQQDPDPLSNAKNYLEQLCLYFYQNAPLVRVFIRCSTDADFAKLLDNMNRYLWDMKAQLGNMKYQDEDTVRLVSTFMGSGCYYLLRQWLMEDIRKTPQEVADLLHTLIIRK